MSTGRSSKKAGKVPPDCAASGSSEVKEIKKPFDTTNRRVREIKFNCVTGNYRTDLVDELRKILDNYDSKTSEEWEEVVRVLFYPTLSQDRNLDFYIDCSDIYSIGVGLQDLLFEYGKYAEEEEQEEEEEPKKKNKKVLKMEKQVAKPGKQNKKKPAAKPVKNRLLLGSHLLGFGEGYGNGLLPPCDVKLGKDELIRSVNVILDGYHVPVMGTTNHTICRRWKKPLTVITVMVCEAARFNPVCWYIELRIETNEDMKLLSWLYHILNEWGKMSSLILDPSLSKPYGKDIPEYWDITDEDMMLELSEDVVWARRAVALICKSRNPT